MKSDEDVIRVAIVEDQRPVREALRALIDGTPGFQCRGTFGSVEAALYRISSSPPDVLLMDIHLPGMSGSEGVRVFKKEHPQIQVLMLTVYEEQEKIFESICNGACGYLLKKTPPARLLEAIEEAHRGGSPITPEIARKVLAVFRKIRPMEKLEQGLTPQEIRLLQMLSEGYSYKAIGDRLKISINTVRVYIRSIYEKLHVHSKAEAVGKALRRRIID